MVVGWIVVSFFTMFVALGMAEVSAENGTQGQSSWTYARGRNADSPACSLDHECNPLRWRTVLLGSRSRSGEAVSPRSPDLTTAFRAITSRVFSQLCVRVLDVRMVQFPWTSRCDNWNHVGSLYIYISHLFGRGPITDPLRRRLGMTASDLLV